MQNKKPFIVGGTTGTVTPIIFIIFDLQELPIIQSLGICLGIGLIIGLLFWGSSKLTNNSKVV